MIINANQGGGGNLQPTVTVTPSTSTQSIKPDPPYNGLSEVIVNPAPLEVKSVRSITSTQTATPLAPNIGFSSITVEPNLLQTKAVTLPTSQPIQPDSGYYGLSGVNVSAPLYQYGTITPSASSRYLNIPSGNYGLDALTVDAAPLTILDVTPTSSPQSFTPTNPYIGYSSVTVGAASGYKFVDGEKYGSGNHSFYIPVSDLTTLVSCYVMVRDWSDIIDYNYAFYGANANIRYGTLTWYFIDESGQVGKNTSGNYTSSSTQVVITPGGDSSYYWPSGVLYQYYCTYV